MPTTSESPPPRSIGALYAVGEQRGCVHESEIDWLAESLELETAELEDLRDELARRGIDVHDDCGRADAAPASYANGELAGHTVDAMAQFLREAGRFPLLTPAEELELARRIERGDLQAKERLINHNLRLVVSIARRYQAISSLTLLDLVQEGMIGLIRAVEKFDWRKGFRFSTYATLWIRQSIQRGMSDRGRAIRLPAGVEQRERRVAAVTQRLAAELGREPTDEEVVVEARITPRQLDDLRAAARVATSLDRPVGDDEATTLGEILPAGEEELGTELHISLARDAVRRCVAELPERERQVVALRYGLADDGEPRTRREIGRRLGLSSAQIAQIEERALTRLARRRELEALTEAA